MAYLGGSHMISTMAWVDEVYKPLGKRYSEIQERALPELGCILFHENEDVFKERARTALYCNYVSITVLASNLTQSTWLGEILARAPHDRTRLAVKLIIDQPDYQDDYRTLLRIVQAHRKALGIASFHLVTMRVPKDAASEADESKRAKALLRRWAHFERLHATGAAAHLGCVGFHRRDLALLTRHAAIRPRYEILYDLLPTTLKRNEAKIEFCLAHGIEILSLQHTHQPFQLGMSKHSSHSQSLVKSLAKRKGRSPEDIILRWLLQMGFGVILHSHVNEEGLGQHRGVFSFALSRGDMHLLCTMPQLTAAQEQRAARAASRSTSSASVLTSELSSGDEAPGSKKKASAGSRSSSSSSSSSRSRSAS